MSNQVQPREAAKVRFSGAHIGGERPTLEGRLLLPEALPCPAVLLCHANPKAGGHMDMGVMLALEQSLTARGIATLRYNSRGVGGSTGSISGVNNKQLITPEGEPETEDVRQALDFLAGQSGVDRSRMGLAGHSFGARISLAYVEKYASDTRIRGVACIGLGVAWGDLSHLGNWPKPKLFITGERDDFCPPALLDDFVSKLPPPSTQVTLKRTGHFFEGRETDMAAVVTEFFARVL